MAYVGVDVSKDRLDVHVLPQGETFVVARDGKGLAELVERMGTLGPERIAVEATGGFETVVAAALAGASLPVVVINPAQVRHFAQALGRRAKTDPIDACMIARFVEATKPDLRPLADEATQLLADLVARRPIASLAGLAPFTRQSGQWKGKAMIAGGRKSVRSALFLASLVACRHNPVLKAFRQRLIVAGKPKMPVAIVAARKLLTILNAILRDKQPRRPETA
jgi:transposase